MGGSRSGSALGVLSPLEMPSPSASSLGFVNNFSPRKLPVKGASSQALLASALLGKDKGKALETPGVVTPSAPPVPSTSVSTETDVVPTREELKAKARAFQEKIVLKKSWLKWKKRLADIVAWAEAVERSDAYRAKLKSLQSLKAVRVGATEKRRRMPSVGSESVMEGESVDGSPSKKRQRKKRISNVYQEPKTDEEIARRLKENREENLKRWEQGSYLNIIRTHVHARMRARKPWNVWLSVNPEDNASAIWLQTKFGVPESGKWLPESIFEIPLFLDLDQPQERARTNGKGKQKSGVREDCSTGLIVFECTPTDHVQDDIEKYVRLAFLSAGELTTTE